MLNYWPDLFGASQSIIISLKRQVVAHSTDSAGLGETPINTCRIESCTYI